MCFSDCIPLVKWHMTVFPKAIYGFSAISIKIPMVLFHRNGKVSHQICKESQVSLNSPNNSEKEKQGRGTRTSQFQNLTTKLE